MEVLLKVIKQFATGIKREWAFKKTMKQRMKYRRFSR